MFCCYITHCKPHLYCVDKLGFEIVKLFEADLHHPPALLVLRHSDKKLREIRESRNLLLESAATGMSLLKKVTFYDAVLHLLVFLFASRFAPCLCRNTIQQHITQNIKSL